MSTSGIVVHYKGWGCHSCNTQEILCFKWEICVQVARHFSVSPWHKTRPACIFFPLCLFLTVFLLIMLTFQALRQCIVVLLLLGLTVALCHITMCCCYLNVTSFGYWRNCRKDSWFCLGWHYIRFVIIVCVWCWWLVNTWKFVCPPSIPSPAPSGRCFGWKRRWWERQSEKVVEFVAWWSPVSEVVNGGSPWEWNSSIYACNLSIVCVWRGL